MPIDYHKWDHIEVSDDEDDTHPNIDTPSLFKWRHEARLQRMAEQKAEKEKLEKEHNLHVQKMAEMKEKLKDSSPSIDPKTKEEIAALESQEREFQKKEEELRKKERLTPHNIDTLCKEGTSKTLINKPKQDAKSEMTEEEKLERQKEFTDKNQKLLKKFGMLRKYEDSQAFLMQHPELTCEETANFLVLWCIDLAVEEKNDLMNHVAHQTIVMQFILELARSLKIDPRSCVNAFFTRVKQAEKQYLDAFNDELDSFKERVKGRAQIRIEEAMKRIEEEERQKRLGPGGLDPVEVFETLPKELQECFESKEIGRLQEVLSKMDPQQATYHMKRCVDSGMWVPAKEEVQEDNAEAIATDMSNLDASGGDDSGEYENPDDDGKP